MEKHLRNLKQIAVVSLIKNFFNIKITQTFHNFLRLIIFRRKYLNWLIVFRRKYLSCLMKFKRCCCFSKSKQFIFQCLITFWNQTHDVIDYHTSYFSVCCSFSKVYSCVCCSFSKVYSSYYVL